MEHTLIEKCNKQNCALKTAINAHSPIKEINCAAINVIKEINCLAALHVTVEVCFMKMKQTNKQWLTPVYNTTLQDPDN